MTQSTLRKGLSKPQTKLQVSPLAQGEHFGQIIRAEGERTTLSRVNVQPLGLANQTDFDPTAIEAYKPGLKRAFSERANAVAKKAEGGQN